MSLAVFMNTSSTNSLKQRVKAEASSSFLHYRLITEVIESYHGKVLDSTCGSDGMFVSSADFVSNHNKNASEQLSIFGQEKTGDLSIDNNRAERAIKPLVIGRKKLVVR